MHEQQALDADSKAVQQNNFFENLEESATMFVVLEEVKGTILDSCQVTMRLGK